MNDGEEEFAENNEQEKISAVDEIMN